MAEITKAAVEQRAMENCEKAGYAWRLEAQTHPGKKFVQLKTSLNEKERDKYREDARAQLIKEQS
jgi:hypothetical protein